MTKKKSKRSMFSSLRNNFIAGVVVLIPIGITLYLTLFIIKISSKILPKEINPNYYLPYNIPGLEILISEEINANIVAIFGAIIPEPLAIPVICIFEPSKL